MSTTADRDSRVRQEVTEQGKRLREASERNGKPISQEAAEKFSRENFINSERRQSERNRK